MTAGEAATRPFCAEDALARDEPLTATASRVEHWLLVEYSGYWPHEPLDAAVFAGSLRAHLEAQLERLPRSRLLLVKRHGRGTPAGPVRVFYGYTRERARRFFSLELEGHPDLLDLDVASALLDGDDGPGRPLDHPLLVVCTHGIRDRCCARYGQALFRTAHGLEPAWTWQATHVGGDRFAGNLVAFPEGLYFGRAHGDGLRSVLREYAAGRVALEWYRGASCYPMPVQAAEIAVRRETGLTGFYDLRLVGREGDHIRLLADVAGDVHEVEVDTEIAEEETYLTCKADEPRRARRFVARSHRVVS